MSAKTNTDKRIFCASFSVRNGTKNTKFELADATLFGGAAGLYRVRINRRWHGVAGETVFLNAEQVSKLVMQKAFGENVEPLPRPNLENKQRVFVTLEYDEDGFPIRQSGTWTHSPPIYTYEGKWKIAVLLYGQGVVFVDCADVVVK